MAGSTHDRLVAVIGKMGSNSNAGDGEAVNAFRQASKMLERQGLTWHDVAQSAFRGMTATARPKPEPAPRPAPPPPPTQPPPRARRHKATGKRHMGGNEVPVTITGTIRLLDEARLIRRGATMVFEIETADTIYGPLTAQRGPLVDNILSCDGRRALMRIRPPGNGMGMAQAVGCSEL